MNRLIKTFATIALALVGGSLFAYNGGYENSLDYLEYPGVGYGNYTLTAREESGTTIDANRYAQCKALKSVDLTGVTSIGDAAFAYSALESVTIPATVSSMGFIAFGGCSNLTSIVFENSSFWASGPAVNTEPFRECSRVTTVSVPGNVPAWDFVNTFPGVTKVYAPQGCEASWRAAYPGAVVSSGYAIRYEVDGGVLGVDSPTEAEQGEWKVLYAPTKEGYVFGGWTVDSGLDTSCAVVTADFEQAWPWASPETNVGAGLAAFGFSNLARSGNTVVLRAHWIANEYTISYQLDGGTLDPSTPTVVVPGDWEVLFAPSKEGYLFDGWTVDSGLDTSCAVVTVDFINAFAWYSYDINVGAGIAGFGFCDLARAGGSVVLRAHWRRTGYEISYQIGEGATLNPSTPTYKEVGEWDVLPAPTRPGYSFGGWRAVSGLDDTCAVVTTDFIQAWQWWPAATAIVGAGIDGFGFSNLAREGGSVVLEALWTKQE